EVVLEIENKIETEIALEIEVDQEIEAKSDGDHAILTHPRLIIA
ncbi:5420_t:CDS:1, partial [Gigaspora rosea]